MCRITLFDHLDRSPESGPSRQAVTNSARYGLTEGGYQADALTLTDDGIKAVSPDASARDRARAQFRLAIERTPAFNALYERFSGNKLPAQQVMRDFLTGEHKLSEEDAMEAVELFIVNARDIGLLRTLSGAERILTLDHLLDLLPASPASPDRPATPSAPLSVAAVGRSSAPPSTEVDLTRVCFLVTPIGEEGTEQRKHADLILGQIIEPAIEALGLGLTVGTIPRSYAARGASDRRSETAQLAAGTERGIPCRKRWFPVVDGRVTPWYTISPTRCDDGPAGRLSKAGRSSNATGGEEQ